VRFLRSISSLIICTCRPFFCETVDDSNPKYFENLPDTGTAGYNVRCSSDARESWEIKMSKFTSASGFVVGAAIVGIALAAVFASPSPPTTAEPEIALAPHQPLLRVDHLPLRTVGAACSAHGWPYYDQGCRFDLRTPDKEAQTVRLIALR
jgi:hypothetical protein